MLSMTGFGTACASGDYGSLTVQVSSVNNRGCQISLKSELRDPTLDEAVRRTVRETLVRGSITVHITLVHAQALAFDTQRLIAAWQELAALARQIGAPTPALERVASLHSHAQSNVGSEGISAAVIEVLRRALAAVHEMRAREGRALAEACVAQARELRRLHTAMQIAAPGRVPRLRDALATRLRELTVHPLPDDVLARELAIHADRIDISEELVRLASHLDALDEILAANDDAKGRKLEFLLQEIGREINTTGAKANDVALTRMVLEAKNVLEQVREQVANIA